MKKIVTILCPFDRKQNVYVFENNNKIADRQVTLDDFNSLIFQLKQQYDVNQIDISGPKQFVYGIKRKLEEAEIAKYNENKLIINVI